VEQRVRARSAPILREVLPNGNRKEVGKEIVSKEVIGKEGACKEVGKEIVSKEVIGKEGACKEVGKEVQREKIVGEEIFEQEIIREEEFFGSQVLTRCRQAGQN
jgi:hypothetical protein